MGWCSMLAIAVVAADTEAQQVAGAFAVGKKTQ